MLEGDRLYRQFHEQMDLNVFVPAAIERARRADKFWKNRDVENRHVNRCIVNSPAPRVSTSIPTRDRASYSASKAALNYLTLHMAQEFGAIGIRVNALAPTSFPSLDTHRARIERRHALVETDATGKILVLDTDGERWQ